MISPQHRRLSFSYDRAYDSHTLYMAHTRNALASLFDAFPGETRINGDSTELEEKIRRRKWLARTLE